MKIFEIALSSILGATLGVALTYFVLDGRIDALKAKVDQVTPVATVDFLSIAQNSPPEGLTDSVMKRKLDNLKTQAQALADRGFVVLRHEHVYSAPKGLVVRDEGN
ncbi:hypothetical protein [Marinobacter sp. F3R08]|uniref:hypothetical protein n=1 Tax=Marinobacter sp. F3R08 TaxID=2841559 RepID=UPI001C088D18|nr:hypothetical protein [Marinobacter sp. F3R08]MBU2952243.1 hypothetical protein [Marinobacter sp. F3R08]